MKEFFKDERVLALVSIALLALADAIARKIEES